MRARCKRSSSSPSSARSAPRSTRSRIRCGATASTIASSSATSARRNGFKKLGVEHIGSLITRGVLIDVAGLKGVDMLPTSYIITPDDLQQALAKASQKLQPGDTVVIRTGWSKLMGKDNQRYGRKTPALASRRRNGWSPRTR